MESQVEKLEHLRRILFFEFNRGAKAAEAAINFCAVYGDNAIAESTGRKWLSRFKEDRFDISDTPRPGRPSGFDEDRSQTFIHNYPRQCTRELPNVMGCDHSTILRHLHSSKVQSGIWVPHDLNKKPQNRRVAICVFQMVVIDWFVNYIDHSYPVSLLVSTNGIYMLT